MADPQELQVGDCVGARREGDPLRSGSCAYEFAVVATLDPFRLISPDGDMMWSTRTPDSVFKISRATPRMLARVNERLRREGLLAPDAAAPTRLHAEAFALMWYRCDCSGCYHSERIWNARDGVTPAATACPSCGRPTLAHVAWDLDRYAPDHLPHHGQRMWIDMTRERAEEIARARLEHAGAECSPENLERLAASIYGDGKQPDLAVAGHVRAEKAEGD